MNNGLWDALLGLEIFALMIASMLGYFWVKGRLSFYSLRRNFRSNLKYFQLKLKELQAGDAELRKKIDSLHSKFYWQAHPDPRLLAELKPITQEFADIVFRFDLDALAAALEDGRLIDAQGSVTAFNYTVSHIGAAKSDLSAEFARLTSQLETAIRGRTTELAAKAAVSKSSAAKAGFRELQAFLLDVTNAGGRPAYPSQWNTWVAWYIEAPSFEDFKNLPRYQDRTTEHWLDAASTAHQKNDMVAAAQIIATILAARKPRYYSSSTVYDVPMELSLWLKELSALVAQKRHAPGYRPTN